MKRIIVGAMARSGSTWTFNACRMLAERRYGKRAVNASDAKSYQPIDGCGIEILKAHEPLPDMDGMVITCERDIRDAFCSGVAVGLLEVASYARRGLCQGVYDGMDLLFADPSRYWGDRANMAIRFEHMMIDKIGTLRRIARTIDPDHTISPSRLEMIAMQLEYTPMLYHDYEPSQSYLFGRSHTTGVGVGGHLKHMPWEDAQDMAYHYEEWFEEFNYPIDITASLEASDGQHTLHPQA